MKDAQEHRPGRRFYRHRHEAGDGRRRAFVGIGQPLVKGDGGNLEKQSGRRGQQGDHRIGVNVILMSRSQAEPGRF